MLKTTNISEAKQNKITVLLSVFGVVPYLQRQLDSIAAQTHAEWNLIWRDDSHAKQQACHSTMAEFQSHHPRRVMRAAIQPSGHLGICASFMCLLAQAPDDAPYVAFSDQDDVWLPTKLERACAALSKVPEGVPALYCSRQRIVDHNLKPLGLSALPSRPLAFSNAIVQNIAPGSTIVLNRPAREAILRIFAPASSMHDWWSYIVVTAIGGTILYDTLPTILYRQHAANSIGAERNTLRRALRAIGRGPNRFLSVLADHLAALAPHRAELLAENADLVEKLQARRQADIWQRMTDPSGRTTYRQRWAEDLLLRLWFLFPLPPAAEANEPR
ncbi:MAG TPA: glycosyltransferase [Roseococcus sp.]|jgi:hypothetical protein|nr:glycosyltransferase [Roseococcus sp.]